jgi:large subunit ribosomal protein L4
VSAVTAGSQAVHDVVAAYLAGLRAGTASTLNKGRVAGSGRKPWRQKGTGRARAGYRQSPVWRGGGVAWGPHPRSYAAKVPRKVAHLAFRRAFSDKVKDGAVQVLDALAVAAPKTKAIVQLLKALRIDGAALFIVEAIDRNALLALRNVPGIAIATARTVSTYEVVRFPKLVITQAAMDQLRARLAGRKAGAA